MGTDMDQMQIVIALLALILVNLVTIWITLRKTENILEENTFRMEILEMRQRNSELDTRAITEQLTKEYNKLLDLEDSMLPTMPHNCMWSGEDENHD